MGDPMRQRARRWLEAAGRSACRIGWPRTDKDRAAVMISSLFLRVHPARVSRHSLRASYTLGLGLISAILFAVLTLTGLALMLYYFPHPAEAYRSMKDLQFVVTFGVVLRNLHRWSAHAMVIVVFLHLCRVFWTGSYKAPREFNWVVGVALLLLTLALSFTGYLLPWDQLALWAMTVGTNIAAYAHMIGERLKFLRLGGHVIGPTTLLRFYVLHCVFLPLAAAALISLHVWRVRKDGLSGAPEEALMVEEVAGTFPASTKTYGLMALPRRPTASVEARDPSDEVFAWPHLLYLEVLVALGVVILLHMASLLSWLPSRRWRTPPALPTRPRPPGTSWACRSSSTTRRSWAGYSSRRSSWWRWSRCPTWTGTLAAWVAGSPPSAGSRTWSSPRWSWSPARSRSSAPSSAARTGPGPGRGDPPVTTDA